MSNPLSGTYDSSGDYSLSIEKHDEASGKFSGRMGRKSTRVTEEINGTFHFYNDRQRTFVWFSTGVDDWELIAPYKDGSPGFSEFEGARLPKDRSSGGVERFIFTKGSAHRRP
jgi:hypothetical protein